MAQITVAGTQALKSRVGQEVVVSDWLEITQERVNRFADATNDHQWIHLDAERSARESPFRTTIGHGFLTLSLLSYFLYESIHFEKLRMGVNYGMNRVRFTAPAPVGSRLRARFALLDFEELPENGAQLTWKVTIEREGGDKPVMVAEWLTRRYE